jgi:hypothetical protein
VTTSGLFPSVVWAALLGVFVGGRDVAVRVERLESWTGDRHAAVMVFTSWDDRPTSLDEFFRRRLPEIWDSGHVPLVTWEPSGRFRTSKRIEVQTARGRHDDFVRSWARHMRDWLAGGDGLYGTADDRRAWLRFAPEMNGDWTPWGAAAGANDPADFIAMWRRVRTIFSEEGLDPTRLAWIWSVNASDHGGRPAEAFWPGDDAVEWIGLSGFNWGASRSWSSWRSPAEIFDPMLARLRALSSKPVALVETATTSRTDRGRDAGAKSAWVRELYVWAVARRVGLVVWFDEDKETDWAVFGGRREAVEAYRAAVAADPWSVPRPDDPRLLDDRVFLGLAP